MTERDERQQQFSGDAPFRASFGTATRWRAEFPYHWDADELVYRRQLLRFAAYTSGALFFSTALLALLGRAKQLRVQTAPHEIVRADQLAENQVVYFNYPGADDQAMLLRLSGDRFVAYSQRCTHLSCAVYFQPDQNRLYCPCHDGVFNPETGDPVAGPPQRRLPQIQLMQQNGTLYAVGQEP
jgi:nitrite reductase/ring-hydroxylating ferredoxin subunit